MARTLRGLGIFFLAAAVWLALSGAAGWLAQDSVDSIAPTVGLAGLAALGAGIVLGFLSKVTRPIRQPRCVSCGTRVDPGKTYCMDHLLATVSQTRERAQEKLPAREAPRRR